MLVSSLKTAAVFAAFACAGLLAGGPSAGQERKKAAPAKDGATVRGTLAGVDAGKNTVTITTRTFDRKSGEGTETNKTFTLAKDAKVVQDEAAARLADLKLGFTAVVKLDGTTVVSVSVEGGTSQAEFRSANAERNTITVIAGRDFARRVVHLLKDTKVLGADGKAIRVQDLKAGTKIQVTRSVEDENTAVRIQALPEPTKKDR
jgi:hypothetical protein